MGRPLSLTLLLDMAVSGHPDRIALGTRAGGITFEQLGRNAAGGATVLRRHDARHVVFIGRNGPCLPQLLFASAIAGIPFVPLNYRLSPDQLREMIAELDQPLLVADEQYFPPLTEGQRAISVGTFLAEAAAAEPLLEEAPADDGDPAVLLFTSGTTAQPKAVVLRHEHLVAYILSTVEFGAAGEDEAALVSVPPYHVAGVGSVLSNCTPAGGWCTCPTSSPRRGCGWSARSRSPTRWSCRRCSPGSWTTSATAGRRCPRCGDLLRRGADAAAGARAGAAGVLPGGLRQRLRADRDQLDDRACSARTSTARRWPPPTRPSGSGSAGSDGRVPGIEVEIRDRRG